MSKQLPFSFIPSVKLISEMHPKLGLYPHLRLCTSTGCRRGVGGGGGEGGTVKKVRLLLLPLISCFRLLPLNHAAAHNAVKTPQVEEGDGAKQSHGNNLCRREI